eukprot:scaffold6162_cov154-Cylindrotheca_fusiformis.AAC.7
MRNRCGHPLLADGRHSSESIARTPVEFLKRQSSKLDSLCKLIEHLRSQGHKTLIFSQSTKMLDIIERVLDGVRLSRIDGSTREKDRQRRVDEFNSSLGLTEAMLLSTKAAGVGITLTGADRAIIYDPSWNPAEDSQAIDRIRGRKDVRETGKKNVWLGIALPWPQIPADSFIRNLQVHKDGIRRAVMTSMGSATTRYFDKGELRKLFILGPRGRCDFLDLLRQRGLATDENMNESRMVAHPAIIGVSSHDNVYNSTMTVTVSDDNKCDSPFGTPCTPPPPSQYEKSENAGAKHKTLGRSQRVLFKDGNARNRTPNKGIERSPDNTKRESPQIENISEVPNLKTSKTANVKDFAEAVCLADKFCKEDQKARGMEVLMDLLEGKLLKLDNEEKVQVHERIASVATKLQWL